MFDNNNNILICADFNARIGQLKDYVPFDSSRHIDALPSDYVGDTELPRRSCDNSVNDNGTLLIDLCIQTGLRVANGRVGEDINVGKCTYVGSRGSSLIDYVIVSEDLLAKFTEFYVSDPNILSDHCCVNFSLKELALARNPDHGGETANEEHVDTKYVFDRELLNDFKTNLSSPEVTEKFENWLRNTTNVTSNSDIDTCVNSFICTLDCVCEPLFEKKIPNKTGTEGNDCRTGSLFNEECENKKIDFLNQLNQFRSCQSDINRINMVAARTEFKRSVRKHRFECRKQKTRLLLDLKYKNAKEYWKLLKDSQNTNSPKTLSAQKFLRYFQSINDPETPFYQADEDILHFNDRFFNSEIQIMFAELDVQISEQEIINAIKHLHAGKSGGPDRVLNEFLERSSCSVAPKE